MGLDDQNFCHDKQHAVCLQPQELQLYADS